MDLVALGQHGDVVTPVVGGGAEAMDQQQGRTDRLVWAAAQAVDGLALVAPGELLHPLCWQGQHRSGHREGGREGRC